MTGLVDRSVPTPSSNPQKMFCQNGWQYRDQRPPEQDGKLQMESPATAPILIILFVMIFYVFGYLKEYEFEVFGDLNNVENGLEIKFKLECDFDSDLCNGYKYPPATATSNPTPFPQQPQVISLVVETIFGILIEYVFVNEINENENDKCDLCEILNVNMNVDCNGNDCNEYDYPPTPPSPSPSPSPTSASTRPPSVEFIKSRVEVRKRFDFIYLVAISDNGNNIIGDNVSEINDENFYDNGYYPTPTPAPSCPTAIVFNGIHISECIFGVCLCESSIDTEISFGMWYFYSFDFCFFFVLILNFVNLFITRTIITMSTRWLSFSKFCDRSIRWWSS